MTDDEKTLLREEVERRLRNWRVARWVFVVIAVGLIFIPYLQYRSVFENLAPLFTKTDPIRGFEALLFSLATTGRTLSYLSTTAGLVLLVFVITRWNGSIAERAIVVLLREKDD